MAMAGNAIKGSQTGQRMLLPSQRMLPAFLLRTKGAYKCTCL